MGLPVVFLLVCFFFLAKSLRKRSNMAKLNRGPCRPSLSCAFSCSGPLDPQPIRSYYSFLIHSVQPIDWAYYIRQSHLLAFWLVMSFGIRPYKTSSIFSIRAFAIRPNLTGPSCVALKRPNYFKTEKKVTENGVYSYFFRSHFWPNEFSALSSSTNLIIQPNAI